jgi:hypothetical protein
VSTELLAKINAACAFGTPNAAITHEILDEVRELQRKLDQIREIVSEDQYRGEPTSGGELASRVQEVLDR